MRMHDQDETRTAVPVPHFPFPLFLNACSAIRFAFTGKIPTPAAWSTTRSTWPSSNARAASGCARWDTAGTAARGPRPGVRGAGDADRFPRAGAAGRFARGRGRTARMPAREPGAGAVDPARRGPAARCRGAGRGAGRGHTPARAIPAPLFAMLEPLAIPGATHDPVSPRCRPTPSPLPETTAASADALRRRQPRRRRRRAAATSTSCSWCCTRACRYSW